MSTPGTDHVVADADELDPGDHLVAQIEGREVGVFNIDGEYVAYTNWCPHHGGPVCEGGLDGTTAIDFDRETLERSLTWVKDGQVLRCPWHAWEFDVTSGDSLHTDRYALVDHEVRVEDETLVVTL